jgi:uncharacterized repeat protein (TIGR01451 family)
MQRVRIAAAFIATLEFLYATVAFAKPAVVVTLSQATVITSADGTSHVVGLDANVAVNRGVVIRYTISAKDTGVDPARRLQLTGHVPPGTAFVAGSMRGPGGHTEFSLDGKTFSAHPLVAVRNAAGTVVMQPADPAQYVLIRWIKDGPLAPAAAVAFTYDVQVR